MRLEYALIATRRFALGSGSARGRAHIGVIDSLIEAGIEPDDVRLTGGGLLNGRQVVAFLQ
jgi:predicted acylesterase/phospholipase RssA